MKMELNVQLFAILYEDTKLQENSENLGKKSELNARECPFIKDLRVELVTKIQNVAES